MQITYKISKQVPTIRKKRFSNEEVLKALCSNSTKLYVSNKIVENFFKTIGESNDKLDDIISSSNNPYYICEYVRLVKNASLTKLADGIIASGNVDYMCVFASIKGAPVEKLADAVIQSKRYDLICYFAKYVKNAPLERLTKAILHSKNEEYIKEFSDNVECVTIVPKFEGKRITNYYYYLN